MPMNYTDFGLSTGGGTLGIGQGFAIPQFDTHYKTGEFVPEAISFDKLPAITSPSISAAAPAPASGSLQFVIILGLVALGFMFVARK